MSSKLNQPIVLVLNAAWQALQVKTPAEAFVMMAGGSATALNGFTPTKWEDWIKLPIEEGDDSVCTPNMVVKIPRIILAVNFDKVVARKKALNMRNLAERDGGRCAYTGVDLTPETYSKDHVIPRSRGGATSWENVVLAHKDVNCKKGDKTPEEAGLKLRTRPVAPKAALPCQLIAPRFPEWERFLKR